MKFEIFIYINLRVCASVCLGVYSKYSPLIKVHNKVKLSTVNLTCDFYSSLERICWTYVYSYLKEQPGISTADMNFEKMS